MFSLIVKLFSVNFFFVIISSAEISRINLDNICQSGLREDNTNYIYCARQNLSTIPNFFGNQNSLQVNSASLSNIVYDELVLTDNQIERIDHNSINIKVRKLYLDSNPLRVIDKQSFEHVKNYLEELYLEQKLNKEINTADSDYLIDQEINTIDDWQLFDQPIFQKCGNLKLLSIKNYNINRLKSNGFIRMIKLEILTISNDKMRQIDDLAFVGLEQTLLELNLDSNYLELVPTEALQRLKRLKRLSLSQNRIKNLHSNAFFYAKSLIFIDLSYNYLNKLDENAFSGSIQNSLKTLNLQNNELKWSHFIHILYNLHILNELNLDFNKLGVSNLKSTLVTAKHFIEKSQNYSLIHLKLNSLSMQGNGLTDENLNMFMQEYDYDSLNRQDEHLDYSKSWTPFTNETKVITNTLKSPLKLKPNLKQFKFSNLARLNLARNKLTRLPAGFFQYLNMVQLKSLTLEKNQLQNKFNTNFFIGLEKSLTTLNLNNIGAIFWSSNSIESLFKLDSLESLKLNGNGLSKNNFLSYDNSKVFKEQKVFPNLVSLELQNNNFDNLPEFICGLKSLSDLDLGSNSLQTFDLNFFNNLKQLNLNNNPLKCDCKMKDLKNWLTKNYDKELLDLIHWECVEPIQLRGQYFTNVNLEDLYCLKEIEMPTPLNQITQSLLDINKDPILKNMDSAENIETSTISSNYKVTESTVKTIQNSDLIKKIIIESSQNGGRLLSFPKESTNEKLLNNLDIGYFTLIIGISFGISAICVIILAIVYLFFIRRQEKISKTGMLQLFNPLLINKYENRRICSPTSITTTSSSLNSKRTQTPELKEIFSGDDSFSRNSSITNSSEVLIKIAQSNKHHHDCCFNNQHFYHSLNERANCNCSNRDNGYFQINEGFNTIANYNNKTFLNDYNKPESSSCFIPNNNKNGAMIFSIDDNNTGNNENHIYHEINTPVKTTFTGNFNHFQKNDFLLFPTNSYKTNTGFINSSNMNQNILSQNSFLNNCSNSLIV